MKIYRYFYADPATASTYVGTVDVKVWYYIKDSAVPIQAKVGGQPPAGAESAILTAPVDKLAGATFVEDGSKDPIPPPPPPPPSKFKVADYLAEPKVKQFFATLPRDATPTPTPTSTPTPTPTPVGTPDVHALVVQITGYPALPLPEVFDADDIAAALRDPDVCAYPPSRVLVLKDREATRAGLLAALEALAQATTADSTVFIYYSGHGGQVAGKTYVLPFDTDLADIAGTSISATELAAAVKRLRAKRVLMVFDCCHAGGLEAKDVEPLPDVFEPGLADSAHAELVAGGEWALLAASRAGERSYVVRGERNGIFTKHLLAGLRGAVASNDEHVRVFGLYEYLEPKVRLDMPGQHPQFKCDVSESWPIARYLGGQKGVVSTIDAQFEYHALLSFARADAAYVRANLLPAFKKAGLRVVTTSDDLVDPELGRVLGLERGLAKARRTVVMLSAEYLKKTTGTDRFTDAAVLASVTLDIEQGRYSVIPVFLEERDDLGEVPLWLRTLTGVRLGPDDDVDAGLNRLITALKKPLPTA